jgi:hypothetical protein
MKKIFVRIVVIALAALALADCAPRVTTRILSTEEAAAYAAEVDEIVENYFAGHSECDFDKTHRDFDPDWQIDESAWQQECEAELIVRGTYQSKTLDHVEYRPRIQAWFASYHVVFQNDPDVTVDFYFSDDSNHTIRGMEWHE